MLLLAHELRWIRNMVVHEKMPLFRDHDAKHLEMKVTKSRRGKVRYARILLSREEVGDLRHDGRAKGAGSDWASGELTAYFCVSRTRMVLRHFFNHADTEARNNDESGGSLFLWAES